MADDRSICDQVGHQWETRVVYVGAQVEPENDTIWLNTNTETRCANCPARLGGLVCSARLLHRRPGKGYRYEAREDG